jgi:hypothetical protein
MTAWGHPEKYLVRFAPDSHRQRRPLVVLDDIPRCRQELSEEVRPPGSLRPLPASTPKGLRAIDAKLSSGSKAKPNKIVGQMLKKDATKIVLG